MDYLPLPQARPAPAELTTGEENTRLIVSQIIVDAVEALEMKYPETSAERRRELLAIRKRLAK